jgi:hypothetical protein
MSFLIVQLSQEPRAAYLEKHPLNDANSSAFVDAGLGAWTGFYDWLRDQEKRIIGVRFFPFEQAEFLLRLPDLGEWIQTDQQKTLLCFFTSGRNYVDTLSADQDFEEARILKDSSGHYAILLGCSGMTDEERTQFPSAIKYLAH